MEVEVSNLKDFQTPSTMDPGLERIIKEAMGPESEYIRDRAKTFSKSDLLDSKRKVQFRERSSSFTHLRSSPRSGQKQTAVAELFSAVREERPEVRPAAKAATASSPASDQQPGTRDAGLCEGSPANLSQFYEVLLLGKIKVIHKGKKWRCSYDQTPWTSFIDEAVTHIKDSEEKRESDKCSEGEERETERKISSDSDGGGSCCSTGDPDPLRAPHPLAPSHPAPTKAHLPPSHPAPTKLALSPISSPQASARVPKSPSPSTSHHQLQSYRGNIVDVNSSNIDHCLVQKKSFCDVVTEASSGLNFGRKTSSRHNSSSSNNNKTMLLQIGRSGVRLISPDQKQVLVKKYFREIAHCSSGLENKEHFGFICKESCSQPGGTSCFVGYICQCSSTGVVEEIMQGLITALHIANQSAREERRVQQCARCPQVWFDNLCEELEGLPPSKAQSVILRRVETLQNGEGKAILEKMEGAETSDIGEQNQILMMLLKANCEVRQKTHAHVPSLLLTVQPPTPQQSQAVQETHSLSEAAKKAKRSLAESFNGIIRRRTSCDISAETQSSQSSLHFQSGPAEKTPLRPCNSSGSNSRGEGRRTPERSIIQLPSFSRSTINPLASPAPVEPPGDINSIDGGRERSRTVGSAGGETMKRELARKRLARLRADTLREENEPEPTSPRPSSSSSSTTTTTTDTSLTSNPMISIYKKTGSRSPGVPGGAEMPASSTSSRQHIYQKVVTPVKKQLREKTLPVRKNYRELWRTAIRQQILLNRMETENQRIRASEELLATKRLKLDYEDIATVTQELQQKWDMVLAQGGRPRRSELRELVGRGVARGRRGEVWTLIVTQAGETTPPPTDGLRLDLSRQPYDELKRQLTPHQHAILIDLGRTFPNHAYFTGALGPGQLGLFNLLKAYSILDQEVGYCQGLPFLVGLLLMHLEAEEDAFALLKYLMLDLGLRNQFKPDMTGLQVAMYQLTRLLAETQPRLYKLFDRLEVDPSLYATPWFLTLFASNFPLGFVARVMDLIFLEGAMAIIKVGVCLLVHCSTSLLCCENLEEVMKIIRTDLPNTPSQELDDVIKEAASLNVSRQLKTYEVEYSVIQEQEEIAMREGRCGLREEGGGAVQELLAVVAELRAHRDQLQSDKSRLMERVDQLEKQLADALKTKSDECPAATVLDNTELNNNKHHQTKDLISDG